jgi:predicted homoserine dehydrogenase-like protein
MIYSHLFDRIHTPVTVRAGLIGVGDFGGPIVTQSRLIPRLEIPVVADLNVEAARQVFRQAGVPQEDIAVCETRAQALQALEAGKRVVLPDALLMMDLPLDVIATATRVPEAGARFADAAIRHGKHVVMIDKEADSVVGPILKRKADMAGVVFTTDDGDQPGLLMGMVSWARALGMEVLCGGHLHSCTVDTTARTIMAGNHTVHVSPDEAWALERIPGGEAIRYVETRRRWSEAWNADEECGDTVCHLAVGANGTGLLPDAPAGRRPLARLLELPEVLCPVEEGGILQTRGAVDLPMILLQPGEPDPDGGVFMVVANADDVSREVMIGKGLIANSRRSAMLLYRPHHLCGAETAMSILCAGLLQVPTGASDVLPWVDMVATTARDMKAGETLGSPGTLGLNRDFRASLVPAFPVSAERPVPFFMLEGRKLKKGVSAGALLTMDHVEMPADSTLFSLRREQDRHFLEAG